MKAGKSLFVVLTALILILGLSTAVFAAQSVMEMAQKAEMMMIATIGPVDSAVEADGKWYTQWNVKVEKYLVEPGLTADLQIASPGADGKPAVAGAYKLNQWGTRVLLLLEHKEGILQPMAATAVIPLEGNNVADKRLTGEDLSFVQDFLSRAESFVPGQEETEEPAAETPVAETPKTEQPKTEEPKDAEPKEEAPAEKPVVKETPKVTKPTKDTIDNVTMGQPAKNVTLWLVVVIVLMFIILIPVVVLLQPKKYEHRFDKYIK